MASGKKNYFRHSFFARNDEVILKGIEKFGFYFYFFWFALLEICGEIAADNYPESFKIHKYRLLSNLRCRELKLNSILTLLQLECRLSYTRDNDYYILKIANFRKYLGKYNILDSSNCSNKRKGKESKVKESKVNTKYDDALLINLWNRNFPEKMFRSESLGRGKHFENFINITGFVKTLDDWQKIFDKCKASNFLMGKADTRFNLTLTWVIDYDNFINIENGKYDNDSMPKRDFSYLHDSWDDIEQRKENA